MIDVTDIDMVEFVKKTYALSRPQGMGMLHYTSGALSDDEAKQFINADGTVNMDYVKGRACKMNVMLQENGRLIISDNWYDHTDEMFQELLEHVGLKSIDGAKLDPHGPSCNCDNCRIKRGESKLDPKKDFEKAKQKHRDGTAFEIKTFS